jgi:hypothetical protein
LQAIDLAEIGSVQLGLMPAAFMIGSSRASALARNAFISAGGVGIGGAPSSASRAFSARSPAP